MSVQFVTDSTGTQVAVVLDIATYERLLEAADLADDEAWAADYAARKAAGQLGADEQETIPFEQALAIIDAARAGAP